MRDFSRINLMTNQIRNYWMLNSDLRFGQLLENLVFSLRAESAKEGRATDIFYIEDDEMQLLLEKVLMNNNQNPKIPIK